MKKAILLLLGTLLLCLVGVAHASGNLIVPLPKSEQGRDETTHSMVVLDKVYMLSYTGSLYAFDTETLTATAVPVHNADPQLEEIPAYLLKQYDIDDEADIPDSLQEQARGVDKLFLDGETIYGINEVIGALYRVDIAQGVATLHGITRLDFSVPQGAESDPTISSGAISGGFMYLLMDLAGDGSGFTPYRFDMQSGTREIFEAQGKITDIASYKPNHLLLLEAETNTWSITDYDCAAGSSMPLHQSYQFGVPMTELSCLIYDPWRDRVLIQSYDKVLAFIGEATCEVVDYLQMLSWCRAILPDGRMILAGRSIYLRPVVEEKAQQKPLIVACLDLDISMDDYLKVNPDAVVQHHRIFPDSQGTSLFAEQMNLQSSEVDIFELPVGSVIQSALEKGYYYPLNESPIISAQIDSYRPFFRQTVMNDEEIAAIPKTAEQSTLAYSEYALRSLGLTPEDIPSTLEGFLDFLLDWEIGVGTAAHETGITPFGVPSEEVKKGIFDLLTDWYFVLMQDGTTDILVLKADMARLLDKLTLVCSAIPNGSGELRNDTTSPYTRYIANEQPSYLFTFQGSFHPGHRNFSSYWISVSDFTPIAFTLPSGGRPILLFTGTVLIVNPYSTRKERAIDFLNYYIQNCPAEETVAFYANPSGVEWQVYKDLRPGYQGRVEELESRVAAAQGAEKLELEQELHLNKQDLQNLERIRWEVSEQGIEDYKRAIDRSTAFWKDTTVYVASFSQTWRKYMNEGLDGQIVADHFFAAYMMALMESR